jgi:hypothetical protein
MFWQKWQRSSVLPWASPMVWAEQAEARSGTLKRAPPPNQQLRRHFF